MFSYQSLMPAGRRHTTVLKMGLGRWRCLGVVGAHPSPLDSRFRENDELGGDSTGATYPGSESGTCFRTNRSCRLVPAHQGMKIEGLLVLEVFAGAFATATPRPQLDSRFRRE